MLAAGTASATPGPDSRVLVSLKFVAPAMIASSPGLSEAPDPAAPRGEEATSLSPLRSLAPPQQGLPAPRNLMALPVLPGIPSTWSPAVPEPPGALSPLAISAPAAPAQPPNPASEGPSAGTRAPKRPPPEMVGVTIDLGMESAYVGRGLNSYQSGSQMDQNAMITPSLAWAVGETGLTIGYAGVFQVIGDDQAEHVRAGVSHEQKVSVAYDRHLFGPLHGTAALAYTFYPFADAAVAGTSVPSVLEPSVAARVETVVDLRMELIYTAGLQEALAAGRHLYLHPSVAKSIDVSDDDAIDVAVGGGWKVFNDSSITDNQADVQADIAFERKVGDRFYARPGVHYAWTNRDSAAFGEEHCVWVSLHGGVDL